MYSHVEFSSGHLPQLIVLLHYEELVMPTQGKMYTSITSY